MRRLLFGLVLTYGVFFAIGYTLAKVRISTREDDAKRFYVMVTLPNVTPEYAHLELVGCAAQITEDAGVHCISEGWWTSAFREPRVGEPQYEFPWGRYAPRGTLKLTATVTDRDWKVLAKGERVVMR